MRASCLTLSGHWVNAEYGLADPDDPERSQDVSLPHHLAKLRAASTRKGEAYKEDIREAITAFVRREVDAGRVKDRDGVVAFLKAQGFEIPRAGKDYITVNDPGSERRYGSRAGSTARQSSTLASRRARSATASAIPSAPRNCTKNSNGWRQRAPDITGNATAPKGRSRHAT